MVLFLTSSPTGPLDGSRPVYGLDEMNGFVEKLKAYDVIWLGGGHVPTQNAFFHQIQLREKIQTFAGIVIGISAGTMNCADEVYVQPELPGEAVNPDFIRYIQGLGLTQTKIIPHYQMVKDWYLDGMRLYEEITYSDSWGKTFLVLTDGSYLFCEDGNEMIYGEAYIINNGKILQICSTDRCCRWR